MDKMLLDFNDPDCRFRGKPFWAWNGKLQADELRRQIRVMKAMGLGGFFMHSRVGLATAYLSDEWFQMVQACIDEARDQKMEAWLYDEDRWPSGAAGGLVTKTPKYRAKSLVLSVREPAKYRKAAGEVRAFVAAIDGLGLRNVRPLKGPAKRAAGPGEHILAFRVVPEGLSPWYNGYTYLDTINTQAVEKFIEVTHEAYEKHCKADLGRIVPGIFTDEPNYGNVHRVRTPEDLLQHEARVPWTEAIPMKFRKRFDCDLLQHLPEVFLNVDGQAVSKVRHDYFDLITDLFVDNFARLIGEWCARNKVAFTGHVLCEETLISQTNVVGCAQRFYEHMQAPGIDILCDKEPEWLTAKACCSVANQMGRKWVLSELYGCTGWDFNFEGHKSVGDWQAALGISLRCPHLSWFTMLGEAKRDYPASIFFQSPWWREYPVVEDYYARLTAALTRGSVVRDVLVINPIESQWALYHTLLDADPASRRIDAELQKLQVGLLEQHVDFDYGEEEMMSRLSKLVKGKGAPALTLAKAKYTAVVVPPCVTLRSSTVKLLEQFHAAGGLVAFVGEIPQYVDTTPSDRAAKLAESARKLPAAGPELRNLLAGRARTVSLTDAAGAQAKPLLYMLRQEGPRTILFVCSRDRANAIGPVTVKLPATGKVEEWDLRTGARYGVKAKQNGPDVVFTTSFPPTGSKLFVIDPSFQAAAPRKHYTEVGRVQIGGPWDIARDEPNVIVLDMPQPDYGDGWQPREEILKIDQAIRTRMGIPQRGGAMVQPWARVPSARKLSRPLGLRYSLEVRDLPSTALNFAIEKPERFTLWVNGQPVPNEGCGWWVDTSLQTIPVAPWRLKRGTNTIELRIDYTEADGLEACFLTGEFGGSVSGEAVAMVRPPAQLNTGDWCGQGLPFYSAAVTYSKRIGGKPPAGERVLLVLPKHAATLVKVRVDGKPAGSMPWPPYEVDITDLLTNDSLLEIEVISSRRNTMGPMHWLRKGQGWVGPWEFLTTGDRWSYDYQLVPYGLLAEPVLSYRREK